MIACDLLHLTRIVFDLFVRCDGEGERKKVEWRQFARVILVTFGKLQLASCACHSQDQMHFMRREGLARSIYLGICFTPVCVTLVAALAEAK